MQLERQSELLKYEIEACLAPLSGVTHLFNLVQEPLIQSNKAEDAGSPRNNLWSLLPLIVCEAISGQYVYALPAAAALQLLKAAAEVFDDIEDADSSESLSNKYGSAIATNLATTLLILAEKAITRLNGSGVKNSVILHVMDIVNSYYITTCIGQHLDLSLSPEKAITEETCLKIAALKSASTAECACHIGALLATTNQQLIDTFVTFGHNLGMAGQIANDIQGITQGSDIIKCKITLPIIYALTQTDIKTHNRLKSTFGNSSDHTPDVKEIRDLLFNSGSIHYATIKVELFKQMALDSLSEAEKAGARVGKLKLFFQEI
jgi:geranylgeranyl pyrophosphate synthase